MLGRHVHVPRNPLGNYCSRPCGAILFVRVLRSWLLSHLLVDLLQMGTTAASVQHVKRVMTIALKTGVLLQGQQVRALGAARPWSCKRNLHGISRRCFFHLHSR